LSRERIQEKSQETQGGRSERDKGGKKWGTNERGERRTKKKKKKVCQTR